MRRVLVAALVVATVLATFVPGPGEAQGKTRKDVALEYVIRPNSPEQGKLQVTLRFSHPDLPQVVSSFTFQTRASTFAISGETSDTATLTEFRAGGELRGYNLSVDRPVESITFTVDPQKPALKAGEFNSYLGPQWGIVKSESFAVSLGYQFPADVDVQFDTTVQFVPPPGWSVEAPWLTVPGAENRFRLPAGSPLPHGFVVLGAFDDVQHLSDAGREFVYVRIGKRLSYEDQIFPYLKKATTYYEGVYGSVTGPKVLAMSAPTPMFTGGLGSTDSFYVNEDADVKTLAHEYAHVWQSFATVEDAGVSTTWLNEGDADLHGPLSLFVSEHWSFDELSRHFSDEYEEGLEEDRRDGSFVRLVDAVYGSPYERSAYRKGAFTLIALDDAIQSNTQGQKTLSDFLKALNVAARERDASRSAAARPPHWPSFTNEDLETILVNVTGFDFGALFRQYVYGNQYPPWNGLKTDVNIVFRGPYFSPPRALPGEPVVVAIQAENGGVRADTKTLELTTDGAVVERWTLTLPPGTSENLTVTVTKQNPGTYEYRASYLRGVLHILEPARVNVTDLAVTPETPEAGDDFLISYSVENEGEAPGTAVVRLLLDGVEQSVDTVTIPGRLRQPFEVTVASPDEGTLPIRVVASVGSSTATRDGSVTVAPRDSDDDGVPDRDDAYPFNPLLSEKSIANDLANARETPLPAPLALAALALAAAAGRWLRSAKRR